MGIIKHFYNTGDYSLDEIKDLINLALKMKKGKIARSLNGKTLIMLFFNPSLRTRVSFTVAMQKLGGNVLDLPIKDSGTYTFEFDDGVVMDSGAIEHIKEGTKVLSRYCDVIAIRASELITTAQDSVKVSSWQNIKEDKILKSFMKNVTVPVINMESNVYHPCQGLADNMTIKEKIGETKGKKYVLSWVPHPKALPMATPNSQILSACDLGMNIVIVHPEEWELDPEIIDHMEKRAEDSGGSLEIKNSQNDAFKNADIICAKSWGASKYYGNWEEEKKLREKHKDWIIDRKKMGITNDAYFMHCLPVRRNVEVTDEILDCAKSIVIDQAENRMWAQMALLQTLLAKE